MALLPGVMALPSTLPKGTRPALQDGCLDCTSTGMPFEYVAVLTNRPNVHGLLLPHRHASCVNTHKPCQTR
jgi:hypothetical protein